MILQIAKRIAGIFIWRIRHTDEMRSILEVGSEQ